MNYPDNLKYSKDHEWVRVEGEEAYVGITAFAQGELGDIVFVDVDTEGESLDQDEVFGSVEAVNDDPYGEGWMVKIKMSDTSQLDDLMDSDAYQAMLG